MQIEKEENLNIYITIFSVREMIRAEKLKVHYRRKGKKVRREGGRREERKRQET